MFACLVQGFYYALKASKMTKLPKDLKEEFCFARFEVTSKVDMISGTDKQSNSFQDDLVCLKDAWYVARLDNGRN